jgi:hypothetical protein
MRLETRIIELFKGCWVKEVTYILGGKHAIIEGQREELRVANHGNMKRIEALSSAGNTGCITSRLIKKDALKHRVN